MNNVCIQPFTAIEVTRNGDVYTCCPPFINNYSIGNIYESENIEDLWFSQKAEVLRKKILNNDYSLCNLELCRQIKLASDENYNEKFRCLPRYITLAYDKECNLQCITCRDKKYKNTLEEIEIYDKKIDTILVPLLKEAKILALSGSGEALFSAHSRQLIKKVAHINKELKFNINTNGLLFNEENIKALGLKNRINEVFVSLPTINKSVYDQIMLGSNLEVVIKNIKWMAKSQILGEIKKATINTVISVLNYKDISELIHFAKELDIYITISQFNYWGTVFGKNYEEIAVWNEKHKNHIEFVRELKKINYDKCFLSPLFEELKNKKIPFYKNIF